MNSKSEIEKLKGFFEKSQAELSYQNKNKKIILETAMELR